MGLVQCHSQCKLVTLMKLIHGHIFTSLFPNSPKCALPDVRTQNFPASVVRHGTYFQDPLIAFRETSGIGKWCLDMLISGDNIGSGLQRDGQVPGHSEPGATTNSFIRPA